MERSYFATMLFLLLHQIDASYWHEWDMFFLPGGLQGYLVFNALAIPVLLVGYKHVVQASAKATLYAKVCITLGVATFLIHAGFAVAGFPQFHLPLSAAAILLCGLSAAWLAVQVRRYGAKALAGAGS